MSSGEAGKEMKNVTVSYHGKLCFRACAAGNHDQEQQEKEMTAAGHGGMNQGLCKRSEREHIYLYL